MAPFALALAACSSSSAPDRPGGDERIACALGGAAKFADHCILERVRVGEAAYLVVRHPDGGFRRLIQADGAGFAAADGAAVAEYRPMGDMVEVKVGLDRYRFPARQKAP